MDLEGTRKQTESKMEGQTMIYLNALIRKKHQDASSSRGEEGSLI
jgi:hypothetical protein